MVIYGVVLVLIDDVRCHADSAAWGAACASCGKAASK
jgi:hypothetical protein